MLVSRLFSCQADDWWWIFGFCESFDTEKATHKRFRSWNCFLRYLLNTMSLQTYHRLLSTVGGIKTDWFVRIVFIVNLMHGQKCKYGHSCFPLRFCIPHSTSANVRAAQYQAKTSVKTKRTCLLFGFCCCCCCHAVILIAFRVTVSSESVNSCVKWWDKEEKTWEIKT